MQETSAPVAARTESHAPARRRTYGRHGIVAGLALCLLIGLPFVVPASWLQHTESAETSAEPETRVVRVAKPTRTATSTLTLPGNVEAFQSALLYSRINGYLRVWNVDIGDRVTKGQALAEIDTPELDQEYQQSQANLVQGRSDLGTAMAELQEAQANLKQADAGVARAKASMDLSASILKRNEQLNAKQVITAQDLEERRCDYDMKRADLDAAEAQRKTRESNIATCAAKIKSREATVGSLEANVRRLEELQKFKTIRAPFDGIVTRRRAEIGTLVTAGSASTAQELFAVAQSDTLRIRINVPQAEAMTIQKGQAAQVVLPEYPNRVFTATVSRTSHAIDPISRTLTVELELPNADQALLPGTFGQVVLAVRRTAAMCTVPSSVLLSCLDGIKVAAVDAQSTVRLRPVKLGRDFGSSVEVLAGLDGDETLVVNPRDDIADNEKVAVANAPDNAPPPTTPTTAAQPPKTAAQ
jgi:RND family efflux transporter MFP subunit